MLPIRVVIHPTDFGEHSRVAFQLACSLARDYGARLIVLHVIPTPGYPVVGDGLFPVSMEVPREELRAQLDAIRPSDSTLPVERALVVGDPAQEILRIAKNYDANLIVMGTHGRGGLGRLVMGSVAEAVSRKADCPVITVRTNAGMIAEDSIKPARDEPVEIY